MSQENVELARRLRDLQPPWHASHGSEVLPARCQLLGTTGNLRHRQRRQRNYGLREIERLMGSSGISYPNDDRPPILMPR
jgi:hypothetical protein